MAGKRFPNPSKLTAEVELQSHVEWTASLEPGTSCEVDKPVHRLGRPVRREVGLSLLKMSSGANVSEISDHSRR
jgi:hypothetical protein